GGRLDVELDRLLAPVEPDEHARQAGHLRVVVAGEVAGGGPLDLDDPGAEVGQLPGGERRRHRLLDRHDHHPVERRTGHGRPARTSRTVLADGWWRRWRRTS